MSYAGLPEHVTNCFVTELHELPLNHHRYELNRLLKDNPTIKNLKKTKENIKAIQEQGYNFLFSLTDLYNIMQEVEPDFFKPILTKAALVMQDPTKTNREAFQAEFHQFKKQVDEYKTSHPFSTGLGYILGNSLFLILGIALMVTAAVLLSSPFAIPGMALTIGLSLCGCLGLVTTLATTKMLSDNASMQYSFFKNKQIESSESFINDIASDEFENYVKDAKLL